MESIGGEAKRVLLGFQRRVDGYIDNAVVDNFVGEHEANVDSGNSNWAVSFQVAL